MPQSGIKINGRYLDIPVDFELEYSLDLETKSIAVGASSVLYLECDQSREIENLFFGSCEAINNTTDVVYAPDCGIELNFALTYEGIEYCYYANEATVRMQKIEDRRCYDYLRSTVFFENGWFEDAQSGAFPVPKVRYCVQPSGLAWATRSQLPILSAIFAFLDASITGRRYRTCPLLSQVIDYHAKKCGLIFESSILQGDYANLVLFEPIAEKGYVWNRRNEYPEYQKESSTNWYVSEILDYLKEVFNADWRIIDGKLIFERKDYFDDLADIELVSTIKDKDCIEEVCYAYQLDSKCANFRFQYTEDGLDSEGNKAYIEMYREDVGWNDPPYAWQTGTCQKQVPFAPVRFTRGRISGTTNGPDDFPDGEDKTESYVDAFRSGKSIGFLVLPNTASSVDHIVITEKNYGGLPKLILLEPNFNPDNALAIRREIQTNPGSQIYNMQYYDYNYPLYMDPEYDEPELYQRFHYIDDPRSKGSKRYVIDSLEFAPKDFCQSLNLVHNNFQRLYIETDYGKGIIEGSITVNEERRTITVRNIRIKC